MIQVFAIDPGDKQSAWVYMEDYKPINFAIEDNASLLERLYTSFTPHFAIEMVASYGMAVGKDVFETVFWIGRFWEGIDSQQKRKVYRKDVKVNLCGATRANDSNIRQALIDRFGEVGTKKEPGYFYGFKPDIWAAYAVGVTYLDILNGEYVLKEANK